MTDPSEERLTKLLEWYDGADVHLFNIASRKIDSLARQRIADAKRIAELEAVTTKQDMIGELGGRIEALPDIEEKDLDLKYLLRLILDLLR